MRIKMLGLAVVAALSIMALGAASASAATLCSVNTSPCPAANTYVAPVTITANLSTGTSAQLTTSGGLVNPTVTCTNSPVTAVTNVTSGSPITGSITALAFNNGGTPPAACTSANPTSSCTVTVNNLNYSASVAWTAGGNGTLTVNNPNVSISCGAPLNTTCIYAAASVSGAVTGGAPATVKFTNAGLTKQAGSSAACPPNGSWNATYTVSSPNPLFVVQNP